LRNPSGPAGAEWIVSADADAALIQHNPPRKKYKGLEDYPALIPDLKDEVALIKIYGAPTIAITINTHKMTEQEARDYAAAKEKNWACRSYFRWKMCGPTDPHFQRHD